LSNQKEKKHSHYAETVIEPGDKVSALAGTICRESRNNNTAAIVHDHTRGNAFRDPVYWNWNPAVLRAMQEGKMAMATENDGAGGKPQFFSLKSLLSPLPSFRHLHWQGLGWEIITMVADDHARKGRFSAVIDNELNVASITPENFPLIEIMLKGYGTALKHAGLINITGETAVLKKQVTLLGREPNKNGLTLTWGASCTGLVAHDRVITGERVEPGMPIIGFKEDGYRCNGGTHYADILETLIELNTTGGNMEKEIMQLLNQLTIPSKSYARFLQWCNGWNMDGTLKKRSPIPLIGCAHITGGGIWSKLGEILPEGVGANLLNMPKPNKALQMGYHYGNCFGKTMTPWQFNQTFHGGCGIHVVVHPKHLDLTLREATNWNIEASLIGITTAHAEKEILIKSVVGDKKQVLSSLDPC